ncbi:unnamed protein product [Candida parapsilosis]|uniref:Uncharacterized protein n=1 Tax=Candida parapsilosis (strain CDC 317 / ATCC MYA-4646) TaxID=578454 RepID=G8B6I0_CANPC|nr:uncharacterized protein CPAR2_101000 [Candida parapsilosis]KAI5903422.1 Eukaryotic translation initiation factor 4E-4 [Candida parapsilosis]KAI5911387.1 Eukaryotic translation initiation factor 4E-4 [Candida parapsilosis]CAD1809409.1 unnamed protein product [Candida parapsilosis]CCE40062.1 hypothetical protein CPAR2_101000 [Candida parapsilosis]
MSDNLKRAESLFNRIMNQNNADSSSSASSSPSSTPVQSIQSSFPPRSKFHQSHHNSNASQMSNETSNINNEQNQFQQQHHHYRSGHGSHHHYNHNHNHNHNQQGFSGHVSSQELAKLPKLDAAKLTEEALADVSENEHVLPYCWTVWHHFRNKKQQMQLHQQQQQQQQQQQELSTAESATTANTTTDGDNNTVSQQQQAGVDSYLQTTHQLQFTNLNNTSTTISHIASVEQMWTMLTSIKTSYNLSIGSEFLIFKIGVNPVWEDPLNAKGGRWIFRFSRKAQDYHHQNKKDAEGASTTTAISSQQSVQKLRKRTALIWERMVIKILTGNFIPSTHAFEIQNVLHNDICGIVLSVRKEEDIISVWNSNLNFKKQSQSQQQSTSSAEGSIKKPLTPFQARRIICDAILRVIRECDDILSGADSITTVDSGSNERVGGVGFEYRLHVESPSSSEGRGERKSRYGGGGKYTRSNNNGGNGGNGSATTSSNVSKD